MKEFSLINLPGLTFNQPGFSHIKNVYLFFPGYCYPSSVFLLIFLRILAQNIDQSTLIFIKIHEYSLRILFIYPFKSKNFAFYPGQIIVVLNEVFFFKSWYKILRLDNTRTDTQATYFLSPFVLSRINYWIVSLLQCL